MVKWAVTTHANIETRDMGLIYILARRYDYVVNESLFPGNRCLSGESGDLTLAVVFRNATSAELFAYELRMYDIVREKEITISTL